MVEVAVIYRIVLVPTGESYVGSYWHKTGDIPASGGGIPPGMTPGHGWWSRFTRGRSKRDCRWERLEIVDCSQMENYRERRNWWVAWDRQQNPSLNRNGDGRGRLAGVATRAADIERVEHQLRRNRLTVGEIASSTGMPETRVRSILDQIRGKGGPLAKAGRQYYLEESA